ncbi:MAG: prepilin peptidase [Spirochaetota bacterium]
METILSLSIFAAGAVFGSFFLLISDRSCLERYRTSPAALLFERSHCEYCETRLAAGDLIPFLSYVRNGGRCRHCNSTLSIRYPVAEAASGACALIIYSAMGVTLQSISLFFIISSVLYISYTDIRCMIIPDTYLALMAVWVLASRIHAGLSMNNLYGLLFLGGVFLLILFVFPGAFGGGDVKYGAVIGLFFGFPLSVVVLEAALITGSLYGIAYAVASGKGMRIRIPFGPFLSTGFLIALLWGTDILVIYSGIFM